MKSIVILFFWVFFSSVTNSQVADRYNEKIMRATYMILGENGTLGTAFLVGRPIENYTKTVRKTLVTAKHVFDGMKGDSAWIYFREKKGNVYSKFLFKFQIRDKGENIYVSHPTEDIAALDFNNPNNVDCVYIPYNNFATDSNLMPIALQPVDNLYVVGFPYGCISTEGGFPVLRSGRIASFPILPTYVYKSFLMDFEVFPGNSGSPVFYNNGLKIIDGKMDQKYYHFIIGLVSKQTLRNDKSLLQAERLSLATVIYATYILETIKILP